MNQEVTISGGLTLRVSSVPRPEVDPRSTVRASPIPKVGGGGVGVPFRLDPHVKVVQDVFV